MVWLKYFLCLVIILFSGTKLSRYGDTIGEKTGLGGLWIGLVLLAAITSVPEMITGISSAALVGLPDLALGTLFGSCLFNLGMLALLDILSRPAPILSRVHLRHVASAGVGIFLVAIAAGGIFAGEKATGLVLGWVGIPSIILLVLYLVGVRQEACKRGYCFDSKKIGKQRSRKKIKISRQDLSDEFAWLLTKLRKRSPEKFRQLKKLKRIEPHPLFIV